MSDQTPPGVPQDPYAVPPAGSVPPPPPPAAGYPPPPPAGYPAPTYPAAGYPGGEQPPQGATTFSIVALVFAVISLLICLIPVVGALGALVALGLGIGAWLNSRSQHRPQGLAIAATVISGLAFIVGVVWSIVAIAFVGDKIDSFDEADRYCQQNTTTQEDYDICMQEEWLGIDASS